MLNRRFTLLQSIGIAIGIALILTGLPHLYNNFPTVDGLFAAVVSSGQLERPVLSTISVDCQSGSPRAILSWTPVPNATSYVLSRQNPITLGWPQIAKNLTGTTYTDTNFPAGPNSYNYQVKAVASGSRSVSYSNTQNARILSCTTVPVPPPVEKGDLTTTVVVINDNGGTKTTSNFILKVDGNSVTSGGVLSLTPGAHQVTVSSDSSYTAVFSGNCSSTGSVDVVAGVSKTCTITENDIAPPTPVPTPTPVPPPSGGPSFSTKEWGAYAGWQIGDLATFESKVGKQAQYRAVFIHWGNENLFPLYLSDVVKNQNKTLIVFWEATDYNVGTVSQSRFSYDYILNHNWDKYISQFATDAKTYGGPVIIIPFSEMNGNWFPWGGTVNGNTPAKHVATYRYLRNFFTNVPNVKFGWAPNSDSVPDTLANALEQYYPGDAYVDYVGVDGFNFGNPWQTFDQVFNIPLKKLQIYKKPIFIFSFASAQGTLKPSWITDALTVQIPKYPEIKAWIWFNENKEHDWRVWSDTMSLNAFKAALP